MALATVIFVIWWLTRIIIGSPASGCLLLGLLSMTGYLVGFVLMVQSLSSA